MLPPAFSYKRMDTGTLLDAPGMLMATMANYWIGGRASCVHTGVQTSAIHSDPPLEGNS